MLDFNLTCALRLIYYENEMREVQSKLIAIEVGKMFGGDGDGGSSSDVSEAERW